MCACLKSQTSITPLYLFIATSWLCCYISLWHAALWNVVLSLNFSIDILLPTPRGFPFFAFWGKGHIYVVTMAALPCTSYSNKWIMPDHRFMICMAMQKLDKVIEGFCSWSTLKNLTSVFWLLHPVLRMLFSLSSHPLASFAPVRLQLFQWKAEANKVGFQ